MPKNGGRLPFAWPDQVEIRLTQPSSYACLEAWAELGKNDAEYAKKLWKCDDCQSMDFQAHIVWCPAYAALREWKNLKCDNDLPASNISQEGQPILKKEDIAWSWKRTAECAAFLSPNGSSRLVF